MKKIIKLLAICIAAVLVVVGAVTMCTGLAIKKGVEEIGNKMMDAGPQTVTAIPEGILVTKELRFNQTIVLSDFEVCEINGSNGLGGLGHSTGCLNGVCRTVIEPKDQQLPKDLKVFRKFQGACREQILPDIQRYVQKQYFAKVSIGAEVVKLLNLPDVEKAEIQRTPKSKFIGQGFARINKNATVDLNYESVAPKEDEFIFGSKLVKVQYTNVP